MTCSTERSRRWRAATIPVTRSWSRESSSSSRGRWSNDPSQSRACRRRHAVVQKSPLPPPDPGSATDETVLVDGSAAEGVSRTVDHSFLAAPLDRGARGWQITDGWIVVDADGAVQWCDRDPTEGCEEDEESAPVRAAFDFAPADVGNGETRIGGPLAVRLNEAGELARVAVMADSRWVGSSLRGTEIVEGTLVASATTARPTIALAGVPADAAAGCVAAAPRVTVPGRGEGDRDTAIAVDVDGDTVLDVRGASDAPGFAALDLFNDPPSVTVEIDAVTCQALSVVDNSS